MSWHHAHLGGVHHGLHIRAHHGHVALAGGYAIPAFEPARELGNFLALQRDNFLGCFADARVFGNLQEILGHLHRTLVVIDHHGHISDVEVAPLELL